MDVVEVWKDDSFEEENAKSIEHHAYYIKNETGQVRKHNACSSPQLVVRLHSYSPFSQRNRKCGIGYRTTRA